MRILLLANANSIHTIKLAKSFASRKIDVCIFSFSDNKNDDFNEFENITVKAINFSEKSANNNFIKVMYLTTLKKLRKVITDFKPDVLHAHYASSYGFIGALSGFKPFVVSVWGSDVFLFPKKSLVHKKILKYSFKKADLLMSTSKVMAIEAKKYTAKKFVITPFGIDTNVFKPSQKNEEEIIVGTIKSLEDVYGIDKLIKAFDIVKKRNPDLRLKLLIVGKGSKEKKIKKLVKDLKLDDYVEFAGKIKNEQVPKYLNKLSVFVALSNSESFGVAVIEASACEVPVVVSNVGGLPEVVENNKTGFIVDKDIIVEAANKIEILILNKELRHKMGQAGRKKVLDFFEFNKNIDEMILEYKKILL